MTDLNQTYSHLLLLNVSNTVPKIEKQITIKSFVSILLKDLGIDEKLLKKHEKFIILV